ncbi:MAG: 7-carboxy-7-deazaguanine synthase QueE [Ignavibacteria bacterium]|nr:7-carboxy-7-deazaguanine synthase QueE [Ignavibacteria bacterium]
MLKVNEIFFSIQGESTLAGLPCVFVRLTYCNLRCSYCDTEYAFYEGKEMTSDEILNEIRKYGCNLVEITGGEPLVQKESIELLKLLCDNGYQVMLETSGSLSITEVDKRVKIIMDLKTPSSGMMHKNLFSNLDYLKPIDEIKFVIGDRNDYDWSKQIINNFKLTDRFIVLMGCVFEKLQPAELSKWILEDKLNVRLQLQLHKFIWEPNLKGV